MTAVPRTQSYCDRPGFGVDIDIDLDLGIEHTGCASRVPTGHSSAWRWCLYCGQRQCSVDRQAHALGFALYIYIAFTTSGRKPAAWLGRTGLEPDRLGFANCSQRKKKLSACRGEGSVVGLLLAARALPLRCAASAMITTTYTYTRTVLLLISYKEYETVGSACRSAVILVALRAR
jgi:hypothetical protein